MTPEEIVQQGLDGVYKPLETDAVKAQIFQIGNTALDYAKEYSIVLDIIKWTGITATIILVLLFIWFIAKTNREFKQKLLRLRSLINPPESAKSSYQNRWEEIVRHFSSFREGEWKFAIIEADKLVNDVLEATGFEGETMGDKIKDISHAQLKSVNQLKNAHKLRNLIVHDASFKVRHIEVRSAIEQYRQALKELNAIS